MASEAAVASVFSHFTQVITMKIYDAGMRQTSWILSTIMVVSMVIVFHLCETITEWVSITILGGVSFNSPGIVVYPRIPVPGWYQG